MTATHELPNHVNQTSECAQELTSPGVVAAGER